MNSQRRDRFTGWGWRSILCAVALTAGAVWPQESDLTKMSLEDLMSVEVTSVSKKVEKRTEAAAAVYVISAEDIHRSGATTIPEVLRMAPGVQVARLDANKWSVTIRGSSGRFANKLLVLIDGRSVYTPLFSGVEWETRDVLLSDVDRIEVIRGPGGTLWGANAVNGVINIITKKAQDTQGGELTARAGTEEGGLALRYGGTWGDHGAFRIYGKSEYFNAARYSDGSAADDQWNRAIGGFRLDWESKEDTLSVLGDAYGLDSSQALLMSFRTPPYSRLRERDGSYSGGSLLARWTHRASEESELELQAYYDRAVEHAPEGEYRDTFDLSFQQRIRLGLKNDFIWGLGYRLVTEHLEESLAVHFEDRKADYQLVNLFLQDELELTKKLRVWFGTKIEFNEFTGLEIQPGIRAAYVPDEKSTVWAAVSRAVRTPSIIESEGSLLTKTFPGAMLTLFGDDDFEAEDLTAYEAGYRIAPSQRLALDLALYYHDYKHLRSFDFRRPQAEFRPLPPHLVVPMVIGNAATAEAYGAELGVDLTPTPWWHTRLAYTWSEVHVQVNPKVFDPLTHLLDGDAPEQQVYLQNLFDIGDAWEFDTILRYVDPLPSLGISDYLAMDARLAWKPRKDLEIALVGQNLLAPHHEELASSFVSSLPTEVERSVTAHVSWTF